MVGGDQCTVPLGSCQGRLLEASDDDPGSTCVVDGPNTWEATDGHGPGDVRVGWRVITEGLVA